MIDPQAAGGCIVVRLGDEDAFVLTAVQDAARAGREGAGG
jgi:hypothetical protein